MSICNALVNYHFSVFRFFPQVGYPYTHSLVVTAVIPCIIGDQRDFSRSPVARIGANTPNLDLRYVFERTFRDKLCACLIRNQVQLRNRPAVRG